MSRKRHALITGYPGFLAKRLLEKLFRSDAAATATVCCEASRRDDALVAIARLRESLTDDPHLVERIRVMSVDVRAMDIGLSGEEFRHITTNVTEVYHLAALHAIDAEKRRAHAVNVEGTANVLALARAIPTLERFIHFSSAYVSGDRVGVIMEDELECGQRFHNAYERTKHQAEVLVSRAGETLPVTIIRPSIVVGDSRTGEIDRFDSVYHIGMLLAGSPAAFSIPLAGQGRAPLNLVPADYVIDVVHAIACDSETIGHTFHVVDPNPLSARAVYEAIAARAGKKIPRVRVSANLTKALLRIPALERFAAVSHQAIDYLNHMAFYNSRNTLALAQRTGIRCPHFEEYVDNLMQYVRDCFEHAGRMKDSRPVLSDASQWS